MDIIEELVLDEWREERFFTEVDFSEIPTIAPVDAGSHSPVGIITDLFGVIRGEL